MNNYNFDQCRCVCEAYDVNNIPRVFAWGHDRWEAHHLCKEEVKTYCRTRRELIPEEFDYYISKSLNSPECFKVPNDKKSLPAIHRNQTAKRMFAGRAGFKHN